MHSKNLLLQQLSLFITAKCMCDAGVNDSKLMVGVAVGAVWYVKSQSALNTLASRLVHLLIPGLTARCAGLLATVF